MDLMNWLNRIEAVLVHRAWHRHIRGVRDRTHAHMIAHPTTHVTAHPAAHMATHPAATNTTMSMGQTLTRNRCQNQQS
jgi:hypothetical protein